MFEDAEKTMKEFKNLCEGMNCADMMRKMTEAGKSGRPFNCAEMMPRMMQMCCGGKKAQEESTPKQKTPASEQ